MLATHKSPFSGTWYPEDGAELESLLAERFQESGRRTGSFLFPGALGYVVPRARSGLLGNRGRGGHRSLGIERPERIVLLAFPHHGGLKRGIAGFGPDLHTTRRSAACRRFRRFPRWRKRVSAITPLSFNCRSCRKPRRNPG